MKGDGKEKEEGGGEEKERRRGEEAAVTGPSSRLLYEMSDEKRNTAAKRG